MSVNKKYVVIVHGVQKFSNGKEIESGGFVPSDIPEEEIADKLKRKLIAEFDNELSAKVLASNTGEASEIKKLKTENLKLSNTIIDLKKEIVDLKTENAKLSEKKKQAGGK